MDSERERNTRLCSIINVRVAPGEKLRLRADADAAGVSVSEVVRRRYFGKPLISKVDSAMIKELRRVGGLLKHVHNESDGAYSKQTASMLVQLSDLIKELGSDIL
jgi:hypothetical protein